MSDAPQTLWYVFDEPTRILVVDDDPILCEFASVYLTTPMSKVVSTLDSSAALDLLMREQFDVALVDIAMPGMDGFELVERIRGQEKLRGLPIVIVNRHRTRGRRVHRPGLLGGRNVVCHQAGQLAPAQPSIALCGPREQRPGRHGAPA